MLYNVSFIKNNVFQTNLVNTNHEPQMIKMYFEQIKGSQVLGIEKARKDDMRPGKPVIEF